jgi:predicted transposase/invertase (TIGR01784 family)
MAWITEAIDKRLVKDINGIMDETYAQISKHAKDIIQKYTSGLFRNATLEFYGVKTAKIKELINVELPVVEVAKTSTDFIFLLEDDTYLHFEFQTAYKKDDLIRFAMYDLRLYERDKRKMQTVVIYSSDVRKAEDSLNIGSLTYAPLKVMMGEYDGNAIYASLEAKLKAGHELTDADMLNLIFLPLMRNDISKAKLAEKSIELANTIHDETKRNTCIASAFAFSLKYLSDEEITRILEVLRMMSLDTAAAMLTDVAVEVVTKKQAIEIAKKLIKKGLSLEDIADSTGLEIADIKELQEQELSEGNNKS